MTAVSIIVPVHDAGPYVAECLASIERQTLHDLQVICVDDASSDDSLAICRAFAEADARFEVLELPQNRGASAARNCALDEAEGDFVLFMDADDWYPCDSTVERLYRAAVDHGASIAGGEMCEVDIATGRTRTDYRDAGHLSLYNFDRDGWVDYRDWQGDLGYTRFIYRRDLLEAHGIRFPSLVRHEDPVFFVKAMVAAGRFYAVAEPVYCYRVSNEPRELDEQAIRDAVEAHIELLLIARENDLQGLKDYVVDSLEYYLALNVYNSLTYRIGEAVVSPLRRIRSTISSLSARAHWARS